MKNLKMICIAIISIALPVAVVAYEIDDVNNVLKSKQFIQWVKAEPLYFQGIVVSGKPHQKKALLKHYQIVTTREGVYDVPPDIGIGTLGVWSAGMRAFYEKKNYEEAFYYLGGLAAWGGYPKYYEHASMALIQQGQTDRAFLWDVKAADEDLPGAQCYVGLSYLDGDRMVGQDYNLSFKYLFASAEQGLPSAQRLLGLLYLRDNSRSSAKKKYYYTMLSALQGDVLGQIFLSACYEDGDFVTKNYYNAYKWACIALANGSKVADVAAQRLEMQLTKQNILKAQEEVGLYIDKQRDRSLNETYIVVLYRHYLDLAHVSYTTIPVDQYVNIMSSIHEKKQYEMFAFVKTDRVERLHIDIKRALSEFKIGPAVYKVDKTTLKQRFEHEIVKAEQIVYND